MYIPKYINNFTSVRHGHFTSVQTTLYNRAISVYITPNKTSVQTTLINLYRYIHCIYFGIYSPKIFPIFYKKWVYIAVYIMVYTVCKPLVVYVSECTMIKCVLYTCIYPPSYLYILFIYWVYAG